ATGRADVARSERNVPEEARPLREPPPRRTPERASGSSGGGAATSDGATTASEPTRRSATSAPTSDGPTQAAAQGGRTRRTGTSTASGANPPRTRQGRRRVAFDDDFLVEGRLEKPSAYYILRRSDAGYDWARMDAK